ncbi:stage V sporulation protein K [Ornithinibacillus sp. L9]|uniref:Stage V sporulation protein K n=2 Tax=Ornithinibacillus caprae TaxID=2678566 RepID=A0A6N8FQR7_9BACI|nr:stage V sporulation protein K [Ornithinibacillus caprae]
MDRDRDPFKHIEEEFSSFVGMKRLKQRVKEIYATIVINEKRKELGLTSTKQVLHMLFKGNPGTGKTTVARKLAKIYFDMNLLSKGHFIEAERADLVGEYIGQTAQKTRAIIQKAQGGILFIDEAYSLARGGEKDFGKEAIDTLVKQMEDYGNDFVLILAGYPYEMERFLNLNPGLKSRFPFILDFEDYEVDQLMEIARQMASEREYQLTKEAEWKLRAYLYKQQQETTRNFSNARCVRNIIEHAIRLHAVRLLYKSQVTSEDLILLTGSDLSLDHQ